MKAIMPEWINRGPPFYRGLDLKKAAKHLHGVHIGDFCIALGNGAWSEAPYAVFFVEVPARAEYSQYAGLAVKDSRVYIANAASVAEGHWNGMMADDGEVIFSRYRHNYVESRDGSAMVDGGRDYFKRSGRRPVRLTVVRDKLVVNDTLFFPVRDL